MATHVKNCFWKSNYGRREPHQGKPGRVCASPARAGTYGARAEARGWREAGRGPVPPGRQRGAEIQPGAARRGPGPGRHLQLQRQHRPRQERRPRRPPGTAGAALPGPPAAGRGLAGPARYRSAPAAARGRAAALRGAPAPPEPARRPRQPRRSRRDGQQGEPRGRRLRRGAPGRDGARPAPAPAPLTSARPPGAPRRRRSSSHSGPQCRAGGEAAPVLPLRPAPCGRSAAAATAARRIRGAWGPWWVIADQEPAVCPCGQEGQW